MSEIRHSTIDPGALRPEGPGYVRFDGMIEGPSGEPAALRADAERLREVGYAAFDLEIEAGRFSLLLDDRPRPRREDEAQRRDRFARALQDLISALPEEGSVESTLRSVELDGDEVRETLFAVEGRLLRGIGRVRAAGDEDRQSAPPIRPVRILKPLNRVLLGCGGLLAVTLVLFQLGILDRWFAPSAADLAIDADLFAPLIEVDVADAGGTWLVRVRRGEGFPADGPAADRLIAGIDDLARRAAARTVVQGGVIRAQLLDAEGGLIVDASVGLRSLLERPDDVVTEALPRRLGARRIRFVLPPQGD